MLKKSLLSIAAVTVLGAGALGSSIAYAQTTTDTQNPMSSLVQKIATKFNLNQSDVQAVFDASRQERQTQMKAKVESQLTQWVTEGKITEAQKQLILQKQQELQATRQSNRTNMQSLTPQERQTQKAAKRAELQAWAKDNGIDIQYLMPMGGKGFGHFGKSSSQSGSATTQTPSPSVTQ